MRTSPLKVSFKSIIAATAMVAALGTAAPVFASDAATPQSTQQQHPYGGHHPHHRWHNHGGMMMHGLHQLDLSDAQKQSIHAAFKSSREGMRTQFHALMQQRRAFETAVPGTPGFDTAYGSYAQAAAASAEARVKAEADLRTQIYSLLTDTQRAKLANLQAQHEQERQARSSRS